jgi:hypothetical protein
MPEQQPYQANKYRIRQLLLVGEGLERYVARTAPPDQEKWRMMAIDTQVKY